MLYELQSTRRPSGGTHILRHIQQQLKHLSPAERKVAEAILADPETAVHSTTARLAVRAGVSNPMISRLSQSLGCDSFPDLKVKLARSLASNRPQLTEAVTSGDSTETYLGKRIAANLSALEFLQRELNPAAVEEAVQLLARAHDIAIFGMGGSAPIAQDAHHKLFRLGKPISCYSDNLMQRMAAAAAGKNTAVLVISFTGRTRALLEAVEIAKASGAKIIGISEPHSPLAQMADLNLTSAAELEDTTTYVPMSSRIVILTIIDILVTGLALELGPDVDTLLLRIKNSLEGTKLQP